MHNYAFIVTFFTQREILSSFARVQPANKRPTAIFFAKLNPIPLVLLLFKSKTSMFVKLLYGRQDVFLVRVLNETQRH